MPAAAGILRLLADETRLRILHLLEAEPLTVAELTEILDLGQSSISGHLAKLKQAGLAHDVAEGSAHRYRLRDDAPATLRAAWLAARGLSADDAAVAADRSSLERLRTSSGGTWIERVAGTLHREYAPGRTWESLAHGFSAAARMGRCLDIGAGDGALIGILAPACTQLTCLDPSEAMRTAGAARTKELGLAHVRWIDGSGEDIPLPDASQDTVLLVQSLQYMGDPARVFLQAARVLAPGGRLVALTLAAHEHAESARYGHLHRGFSETDLKRWAQAAGLDPHLYRLPPEARQPRFQTLVLTADRSPR